MVEAFPKEVPPRDEDKVLCEGQREDFFSQEILNPGGNGICDEKHSIFSYVIEEHTIGFTPQEGDKEGKAWMKPWSRL
jgi:hypothetical protein